MMAAFWMLANASATDVNYPYSDEDAAKGFISWKSSASVWRLDASLGRQEYRLGEAISIALVMTNISRDDQSLETFHPFVDFHILLRRRPDGLVNLAEEGRRLFRYDRQWSGKGEHIGPGLYHTTKVDLAQYFQLDRTGIYEVQVIRRLTDLAMLLPFRFASKSEQLYAGPISFVITAKK